MESAAVRLLIPGLAGLALGLIVAVVTGLGGTTERAAPPPPTPEVEPVVEEGPPPPPPRQSGVAPPRIEREVAERPSTETTEQPATAADTAIPSQALMDFARREILRGWSEVRDDEIPEDRLAKGLDNYRETVKTYGWAIGLRAAREQNESEAMLEDAATGGLFELLGQIDERGRPVLSLARDRERFEQYFDREAPELIQDSSLLEPPLHDQVQDGMTILYGPGTHVVRNLMHGRRAFPRDVTLKGSGMNVTLLKFPTALYSNLDVRNLTIQDCTVYAEPLTNFTSRPASMRFERVRFVGFDNGAGGSNVISAEHSAWHFVDCRIEGGYGRSPVHGSLFDVRTSGVIARFDNCLLSRLDLGLTAIYTGGTVLFANCDMTELFKDPIEQARNRSGIAFDGCRISVGKPEVLRRDLNDLFPGWRDVR